jgi:hypothetical protein
MSESMDSQHAITDLYDEQRNTFLIQYPPLLVIVLALTGLLAFVLTGFLGYPFGKFTDPSTFVYPNYTSGEYLFKEPWALLAWFWGLMLVLQISIFRHPNLRRQRNQTIAASIISMIIVIVAYFNREILGNVLNNLGDWLQITLKISGNSFLLAIINYGILAIFWVDSIRRWIRRSQGLPITPQVDLGPRFRIRPGDMPSLQELISGDIIAGGALTALLMWVFDSATLNNIANLINNTSDYGSTPGKTLVCATNCSVVDRYQMVFYLTFGLLLLALTAVVNGLGAVGAVESEKVAPEGLEITPTDTSLDETGTEKGTKGVVQTLVETLLAALNRQLLAIVNNFFLALRTASWPFLVLLGTAALALASRYVQYYMHSISCIHSPAQEAACKITTINGVSYGIATDTGSLVFNAGIATGSIFIALLAIIGAAALLVFRWRVAENTLRFVGLVGFIVLLTFWIFALALTGLNEIFSPQVLNLTTRWPFGQPGISTIGSLGALLLYAAILLINRARRGDRSPLFVPQIGQRTLRRQQAAILAQTPPTNDAVAPNEVSSPVATEVPVAETPTPPSTQG